MSQFTFPANALLELKVFTVVIVKLTQSLSIQLFEKRQGAKLLSNNSDIE